MEQISRLLVILYAIKFYSKDIHYNARGEIFFSDHLLADRVVDDLDNIIDDINENLYLGFEHNAPTSKEVLKAVEQALPPVPTDIHQAWKNLYGLITDGLNIIEGIEADYDMPPLNSLLDTTADLLQKKRGLVWRRKLSI